MTFTIEPLHQHPDLVEVISGWHVQEFDPGGSLPFWVEAHRREAKDEGVPTAWIAFEGDAPVGSVSLIERNMDTRPETPWLAALFVLPGHRRNGVGTALMARCEDAARDLGFRELFLYTSEAERFYRDRGWELLSREPYEDVEVAVMGKALVQNATK